MEREWFGDWLGMMDSIEAIGVDFISKLYAFADVRQSAWFTIQQPFQWFRSQQTFVNASVVDEVAINKVEQGEADDDILGALVLGASGYKINPLVLAGFMTGFYQMIASRILSFQAKRLNRQPIFLARERIKDMAETFVSSSWPRIDDIRSMRAEGVYNKIRRDGGPESREKILRDSEIQAGTLVRIAANSFANKLLIIQMKELYPLNTLLKGWLSKRDKRVRSTHRNADFFYTRNLIGIDEQFFVGGEFLPYPTGGKKPANNINCRCVVRITVKDFD